MRSHRVRRSLLMLLALTASVAGRADEPVEASFSREHLEQLLGAEMAISRGDPSGALKPYLGAANATHDPAVIDRALEIANFLQDSQAALALAEDMAALKPEEPRYQFQIAFHAMRGQDYEHAIKAIDRLLELDPSAELEPIFLGAYPQGGSGRQSLLDALPGLEKEHPRNGQLLFAHALLLGEAGNYTQGLSYVRKAREIIPDNPQAILLEARFLAMDKQTQAAMSLLSASLDRDPKNRALNLNYVKLLIKSERMLAAEARLKDLLVQFPTDEEFLSMHGLLAFNSRHDNDARASLEKLVLVGSHEDEAHYYLGLIAKRNDQAAAAESQFLEVSDGPEFVAAQSELAQARADAGHLDQARQQLAAARLNHPAVEAALFNLEADLLNRKEHSREAFELLDGAIKRHPDDLLLLFNRAMVAVKLNNLTLFEQDMQALLQKDPDNPTFLNALGYTLVDMTHRYGEAENYIRRAYKQKPDDPAIIDSMGWLFYRLGDISGALEYVQKAYNSYPDEEIGLHLAELLWKSNRKEDARKVWAELLRKNPGSQAVSHHQALIEQKP